MKKIECTYAVSELMYFSTWHLLKVQSSICMHTNGGYFMLHILKLRAIDIILHGDIYYKGNYIMYKLRIFSRTIWLPSKAGERVKGLTYSQGWAVNFSTCSAILALTSTTLFD